MASRKLVKAFIIDDDQQAIALLRQILESSFSVEVVGTATTGKSASATTVEKDPDMIFLDIQLPDMSGLDFCHDIRKKLRPETKVVFYTGYDRYLLDAIRSEAFDYLLKPATQGEVSAIMTRYYENKLQSLPSAELTPEAGRTMILVVNARNEHMTLSLEDIAFFRYSNENKQWEVVCTNKECYSLRHRTTADAILNYSSRFVQTHKRYIVNINYIKTIRENVCLLKAPMDDTEEVKISKNYKRDLISVFYNL